MADIPAAISSQDQDVRQVEPLYTRSFAGDGDRCGDSLSGLDIATPNHGAESLVTRPRISKTIQIDTTRSNTEYSRATIEPRQTPLGDSAHYESPTAVNAEKQPPTLQYSQQIAKTALHLLPYQRLQLVFLLNQHRVATQQNEKDLPQMCRSRRTRFSSADSTVLSLISLPTRESCEHQLHRARPRSMPDATRPMSFRQQWFQM